MVELTKVAYLAPAPHHSAPWRFAVVVDRDAKARLARAMARRWVEDMLQDGIDASTAQQAAERSIRRLCAAPVVLLASLVWEGLDSYPDPRRRQAEWGMALLSLGAALQNVMLAASDEGLGTCWVAAPIFAPEEARQALGLPEDWVPQALLTIGHPDPSYRPPPRTLPDFDQTIVVI